MFKISKLQGFLLKKYISTNCKDVLLIQNLKERTLLRLTSPEANMYLQGLITNDILHLQGGASSIFTMFLNSKGRILFDSIVYNTGKENTYFIECDENAFSHLKNHLLMYKVRRKVNVDCLKDELDIWTLINNKNFLNIKDACDYKQIVNFIRQNLTGVIATCDPRLSHLGLRIITPKNFDLCKELKEKMDVNVEKVNFYKQHRYKLGIGEGLQELPIEKCFPMEANGDYLNGISFHKGCYIGQELTARTYHTGVIRKRFMPLIFQQEVENSEVGIPIFPVPPSNKPIGKLQGVEKTTGVGLLRIEEALKADELVVLETKCKTQRPFWWPVPATQEKFLIR